MSECCDFPGLFKAFMMHYCAKPFQQVWKVTAFTHLWFLINSIMSWEKSSATAGLGGLHQGRQQGGNPVGGVSDD